MLFCFEMPCEGYTLKWMPMYGIYMKSKIRFWHKLQDVTVTTQKETFYTGINTFRQIKGRKVSL
jgi:hypothetical protein